MAKVQKEIKEIPLEELRLYEKNARIHPEEQIEQLTKSIKSFGFLSPVIIDSDKNVIAGHGRIEAAKRAGLESVPCVNVDGLTDEQRRAYILADNRLSELSKWNKQIVETELADLAEFDIDLSLTGFSFSPVDITFDLIEEETEFEPELEDVAEKAKEKFNQIMETLEETRPDDLNNALAVVVPKGRGGAGDCLIISDPACKDIVEELRRYAEDGVKSPLEKLMREVIKYDAPNA